MKVLARYDTLIAIIGAGLMTIGFYFGVFHPGLQAAGRIDSDIAQIQSQLNSLPLQMAEREQMQWRLDQRREQVLKMATMLPERIEVADVLREVADLANLSQLTITRLEPLTPNEFLSYSALPFSLSCKGDFDRIARFLSGLENQPRLVTCDDVTLTRGTDPGDRQIQASVNFSVYSRHAKTARVAENATSHSSFSSDN
jgi:Tfp pilus assembly protein PilO